MDEGTTGSIQAGRVSATGYAWHDVSFATPIAGAVVLSTIQTHVDDDWVKTRHRNFGATGPRMAPCFGAGLCAGFAVAMETLEKVGSAVDHSTETIGWMALPAGIGSEDFVYEAIVTPDAVTHNAYSVAFSEGVFAEPPAVFAGFGFDGGDPSHLRTTATSAAGVDVFVEEETCTDAELDHTNS